MTHLHEFVALVRAMRAAQREYFKSRSTIYLYKAKEAEGKVDTALATLQNTAPRQLSLTGEGAPHQ